MTDLIKAVEAVAAPSGRGLERVSASPADEARAGSTETSATDAVGSDDFSGALQAIAGQLPSNVDLTYRVDDDLHRVIVEVVDRKDGTVLRQIPGEEALRLARLMQDGHGALLQTQA